VNTEDLTAGENNTLSTAWLQLSTRTLPLQWCYIELSA